MTGPKHLWSGDWERESAGNAQTGQAASAPAPVPPEPPDQPETPPRRRRRPTRHQVFLTVGAGAVAALVGIAIASSLSGPSHPRTIAQTTGPPQGRLGGIPPNLGTTTPTIPANPAQQAAQPPPAQQPTAAPVLNEPTVRWLGMELQDSPAGTPVIDTVDLRSAGEAAGLEPGDQVASVNGVQVGSVKQIAAAVAQLRLGDVVRIQVDRGSTIFNAEATLAGRPVPQP